MKQFLLAALLAVTLAASAFAASDEKAKANASFSAEYPGAGNISWRMNDDFFIVSFTLNNQRLRAFYDYEGNKIATTRKMLLTELPQKGWQSIRKSYSDYSIIEAIEYNNADNQRAYFVSMQKAGKGIVLKMDEYGEVNYFGRLPK